MTRILKEKKRKLFCLHVFEFTIKKIKKIKKKDLEVAVVGII